MKSLNELKAEWLEDRLRKQAFFLNAQEEAKAILDGLDEVEQLYWIKLEELNSETSVGELNDKSY